MGRGYCRCSRSFAAAMSARTSRCKTIRPSTHSAAMTRALTALRAASIFTAPRYHHVPDFSPTGVGRFAERCDQEARSVGGRASELLISYPREKASLGGWGQNGVSLYQPLRLLLKCAISLTATLTNCQRERLIKAAGK